MTLSTVRLRDLPIEWKRGAGLKRSDIVADGAEYCILYGELFTKHKRVLVNRDQLSKTNKTGKVVSKKGDILVPATSTASRQEMVLAREVNADGILLGGDINIIRPKEGIFAQKYLPYFFETQVAYSQLERYITGSTGIIHVSNSGIKNLEIPLPPLKEQEKIVARIEELFSEIDETVKTLSSSKDLLGNLHLSTLNSTTKDTGSSKYKSLLLESLLLGGREALKTGPFGTLISKSDYKKSGVPIIGIENIGELKFINNGFKKHVDNDKYMQLKSYEVSTGDVLISRSGTVGEICVVPEGIEGIISTNLIRVRLDKNIILPEYFIALFKGSSYVTSQIKELCRGSSRLFLNQGIMKQIKYPVPPIHLQRELLEHLSQLISDEERLAEAVYTSVRHASLLKQSILSKAFKGELV